MGNLLSSLTVAGYSGNTAVTYAKPIRFIYLSATKKIKRLITIRINAASDHLSTSIAIKY